MKNNLEMFEKVMGLSLNEFNDLSLGYKLSLMDKKNISLKNDSGSLTFSIVDEEDDLGYYVRSNDSQFIIKDMKVNSDLRIVFISDDNNHFLYTGYFPVGDVTEDTITGTKVEVKVESKDRRVLEIILGMSIAEFNILNLLDKVRLFMKENIYIGDETISTRLFINSEDEAVIHLEVEGCDFKFNDLIIRDDLSVSIEFIGDSDKYLDKLYGASLDEFFEGVTLTKRFKS